MTTQMTMHGVGKASAQKAALLTSHIKRHSSRSATVPKVGAHLDIDINKVVFTDPDGNQKTPMTKARFNLKTSLWEQISPAMAGLLLFFNTQPPDNCKQVRVVSVIPNGRACYVEPV